MKHKSQKESFKTETTKQKKTKRFKIISHNIRNTAHAKFSKNKTSKTRWLKPQPKKTKQKTKSKVSNANNPTINSIAI